MASFVLYMVTHGHLKYGTLQGYIWGVVDHHIQHGHASPLTNVRDWRSFMSAVEIEDPHIPVARLMVPWLLFVRSIPCFDMEDTLQLGVLLVSLFIFFLCTRVEFLPTSIAAFNGMKHLTVAKVRWTQGYLEVNCNGKKQDLLNKRKEHATAGDVWRAVGPGMGIFDTLSFVRRYCSMVRHSDPSAPFFVDGSGRPITQSVALRVWRHVCCNIDEVTPPIMELYSLIGIRVLSRNAIAGVAGDETARIQGAWDVCDVAYDRPMLERVLTLPRKMAEFASSAAMPTGGVLELLSTSPPLADSRPGEAAVVAWPAGPPDASIRAIPHHARSGTYHTYQCCGVTFRSRKQAQEPSFTGVTVPEPPYPVG